MMKKKPISVRMLEFAGLRSALEALRLPFGKECRSNSHYTCYMENDIHNTSCSVYINAKDIELMQRLILAGDEHAKVIRGIMVWLEIDAPRFFWQEMDTYRVGTDRLSSESTMHIQGRGLSTEELVAMKSGLTEGTYQKRVQVFSYQTLRRIYFQRRHHRLPHWQFFCGAITELPFANQLITIEKSQTDGDK